MSRPVIDRSVGRFSWREAGDGDVLLFLHPIVGTRHYWDHQLDELSDSWRCVALDAPGYGSSDPCEDPLADSVTARILEFIDLMDVSVVHVVGLSLGGMFGLHAAGHAPDRFGKIVAADTSAAFGIDPVAWLDEWLAPLRAGEPMATVAGSSIDSIVHAPIDAAARDELTAAFEDVSPAAFERASQYIAEHDVRAVLSGIENECLVIVGEHDGETPPSYSEELVSLLPNARLEVILGVGHLTSIEAPERFSALVRGFLEG